MKIRLVRDARIRHHAGEIVEATASEAAFLLSIGSAEPVAASDNVVAEEAPPQKKKSGSKK